MNKVKMTIDELRDLSPEKADEVIKKFGGTIKRIIINKSTVDVLQLKKDIATVGEWRKLGKAFTNEQNFFAEQVVDRMIAMKNMKKTGVELISGNNLRFIQKFNAGGNAYGNGTGNAGVLSDAVAVGAEEGDEAHPRQTGDRVDVAKAAKTKPKDPSIPELPKSSPKGTEMRQTPDIPNIKLTPPDNQHEGEATSVADDATKVEPKATASDGKIPETSEEIGHNPNEPMPKKMAEELLANVKWGMDVGVYINLEEGCERQLGRKDYAEFVDTPEKLAAVKTYLYAVEKELTDPKAMV